MSTEICEICDESIDYCACWRCMECEQLFPDNAEGAESDTGELVCLDCS